MKKRYIASAGAGLLVVALGAGAYVTSPVIHEGNPGERPELGRTGLLTVGTQETAMVLPDRITFPKLGMASGQVSRRNREVSIRLWYPASARAGSVPIAYQHRMEPPAMEPFSLEFTGASFEDAPPASAERYPLVVLSHGFNGWSEQMSNLGEHLASHGYVVASIDHGEMPIEGVTDFLYSFSLVLAQRAQDQRQVIDRLIGKSAAPLGSAALNADLTELIDPAKIALIGYSMGGFGALGVASAAYDTKDGPVANLPSDVHDEMRRLQETSTADEARISALVTLAPWGGQSDNRVFTKSGLAAVNTPTLVIGGSEDDVSNYEDGIRWIFNQLTGTQRYLLTYENARHNIAGNAFDLDENAPFRVAEFLNEPVWRQERINAINEHFVTAFLDWHVKGEADKASYLNVPQERASDREWSVGFGDQLNGEFAADDQSDHWRGFQRRWAVGLRLEQKGSGK